ncbi:MAG: 3-dehydroquinate synthase [Polyangiaceae bacterium]
MTAFKRPLLIGGFMGTGKSTVGRLVAARAGVDFLDLDTELERRAGHAVRAIFEREGEAGFRARERELLRSLLSGTDPPRVIALGGGALLARPQRLHALQRAVVVSLSATTDEILRRLHGDSTRPLLDAVDPAARVSELLDARALAYAEAHFQLDTSGETPSALAERLLELWRRDPIAVAAGAESYSVEVTHGDLEQRLGDRLAALTPTRVMCVSDSNVDAAHGSLRQRILGAARVPHATVLLEPGEEHKTLEALSPIYQRALELGADRKSVLLGLGGGVVTDITGFAAATWMRGVRWLGAPSTLLAMVDASVGGKTAVDFGPAKNAVGAFWQPSGVVCDVQLLSTEPDRGYLSALSEVIKTALIGDPQLLLLVEREQRGILARDPQLLVEMLRRCVAVKAGVVSRDPRERGERAHLNLGHTLGHAMEAFAGYGQLTHGEAISLGLVAALRLGTRLGHTPSELTARIEDLLKQLGLPTDLARHELPRASSLLGHDKKRAGDRVRFVFARDVGDVFTEHLALDAVQASAQTL